MTTSQRFHLEAYGYLLLENVLSGDEVATYKDVLYQIKADQDRATKGIYLNRNEEHIFHMGNVVNYDVALAGYATHPQILPMVRDLVGGSVRLEESEAIINSRNPNSTPLSANVSPCIPTGFHTGIRHGWGTYIERDKFHCLFVKTLAFLTDVGPGDGGTAVIPGSHKMSWPETEMVAAALDDPRLITQIEATAGSVLLFAESLIHSSTEILSDKERVILVCGYTPPMFRVWPGNELSEERLQSVGRSERSVLSGEESWFWERNL